MYLALNKGMYFHLVARTLHPQIQPLVNDAAARWMWKSLQQRFSNALACVLMPDHIHLIVCDEDPVACVEGLRRITWRFAQHFKLGRIWLQVPEAMEIRGADKLARQIRYVALNPCRKRIGPGASETLAKDPLEWEWSTYRDVVGAILNPWVDAAKIQAALKSERRWFSGWLHKYISADPAVDVAGTEPPVPASIALRDTPTHLLRPIAEAARLACRAAPDAVRRRGAVRRVFVHLALGQGWRHNTDLAMVAGCTVRSIQKIRRSAAPKGLDAARLCLGDIRLLGSGTHTSQTRFATPGVDFR